MAEVFYVALNLIGGTGCLFAIIHWLRRYGTSAIALHPIILFSAHFGIIHFILPVYKFATDNYRYPFDYSEIVLLTNAAISVLVYVLMAITLGDPLRRFGVSPPKEVSKGANIALYVGIALSAFGLFAMYKVSAQVHAMGVEAFYSDRILMSANIGIFTRLDTIALPGFSLMLAGLLNQQARRPLLLVAFFGGFFYAIQYYSLIQSRNSIILLCIICLATYSYYRNQPLNNSRQGVRNVALLLFAVIGFSLFSYNATVVRYAGVDSWYADYALSNIVFILLDGPFGNDENLLWLIEYGHPYYWGQTYLAGLTNLVPREIWPEKPWGAGPEIRNLIYPGSYVIGAEGNSSITTGFLTEARMNFGSPGIILVAFLWVLVAQRLVALLSMVRTVFWQSMVLFSLCFISTAFVYAEFLGFVGRFVTSFGAALAVYVFVGLMLRVRVR